MGIYDVPKAELVENVSRELKSVKEIQPPSWTDFVKTGVFKERQPTREDWWHVRTASVLLKVLNRGPIGVSKLRNLYGGRKNRGVASEHFFKGSGNIARKILQQLEKAGLVAKGQKGVHKGRIITPKGLSLLGKTSNVLMKEKGIVIKPLPKEEPKVKAQPKVEESKSAESVALEQKPKAKRAPRKKKEAEVKNEQPAAITGATQATNT